MHFVNDGAGIGNVERCVALPVIGLKVNHDVAKSIGRIFAWVASRLAIVVFEANYGTTVRI
jgi:hypothetical protein